MQSVIRKTEHTFKKYGVTVRAKFNKIRNGSVLESCEQDNECSGSMKGRQVHSSPAERMSYSHGKLLFTESDTCVFFFVTVPKCCTLEYWKKVMLNYQQQ